MAKKNVALLVFDDVEVLDFAGPFEVFSVADELSGYSIMNVYLVAPERKPIRARNGLEVFPMYSIGKAPVPDVLIIPGGAGVRVLLNNDAVCRWVIACEKKAEKVLSVCTGALLLAKVGLLGGQRATTHHEHFEELAGLAPEIEVVQDERFIDNGRILTSAGISAGIDMSLYVVGQLFDQELVERTAAYMEYRRI